MKKTKWIFLLALFLAVSTSLNIPKQTVYADSSGTFGNLTYTINDDKTISITECNDADIESVTIPEYIEGMPVTEIDHSAFSGMQALKSVSLPDTLKVIGEYAFNNCAGLEAVTIPKNVESIGYRAFYGCASLKEITIPENTSKIGSGCFDACTSLKKLTILCADCSISSSDYSKDSISQLTVYGHSDSQTEKFAYDIGLVFMPTDLPDTAVAEYRVYIQNTGLESSWSADGSVSGTTGQSKCAESIEIRLKGQPLPGDIEYRTHIETYGWETSWHKNGETCSTVNENKRIEAIRIRLTGELSESYDVYYRVHSEKFGWLGWAKNGEPAGTAGMRKRLEALQVIIVRKDSLEKEPNSYLHFIDCSYNKIITFYTHVQGIGWDNGSVNGEVGGSIHKNKRLEAFKLSLPTNPELGSIEYRSHIQGIGWETQWKQNNEISGTIGEARQIEAIQIRLTGDLANYYDIYYRVHVQDDGWLGWSRNGEPAGTEGLGKRIEAMQIVLVKNYEKPPKNNVKSSFIKK